MLLLLLSLLLIKHAVADFFLQRAFMFKDKHVYGGSGGITHAGIHGALTGLVLFVTISNLYLVLCLALADAVLHYHIDYLKSSWNVKTGASPSENRYWYAFGLDQLAHHMTYIGIIWYIVK
jgi:hypothetical protein